LMTRKDSAQDALELSLRAAELTGRRDPPTLETLAAAYAAGGDFKSAASTARAAASLLRSFGEENEARFAEQRASEYERNRPQGK